MHPLHAIGALGCSKVIDRSVVTVAAREDFHKRHHVAWRDLLVATKEPGLKLHRLKSKSAFADVGGGSTALSPSKLQASKEKVQFAVLAHESRICCQTASSRTWQYCWK